MNGVTLPPAGWSWDMSKRHQARYWDGTAWTEAVSDEGDESIDDWIPEGIPTWTVPMSSLRSLPDRDASGKSSL